MKTSLLIFCSFMFIQVKATTWTVTVSDFQFTPSELNVAVGDVITWEWVDGSHTTTSLDVPAGAVAWDAAITNNNTTFSYTVTAAGSYSYQCTPHAPNMAGSFTATSVLPVTISSFYISNQNNVPVIKWTTETEINSDHFSIRKSSNGKDFNEIGQVKAAGNSSINMNYSFSDERNTETSAYLYYALAIVDKDGKTQLLPIKIYKNKTAASKLIISLSPNPISEMGHLMLRFNGDKPGLMSARLIDAQGKLVLKTQLSVVQGINNGHIHLGGIPAGVYTLYFSRDGINESYKISKR